jgi:Pyruvate/2-oxoacid:ferredoxin oxidoreductase gamma subunit
LIAAYASLSGIVKLESLVEEMTRSLPPYRRQHAQINERALQAGYEALTANLAPAWTQTGAAL